MIQMGPKFCDATDGSCPDGCTMENGGCKGTVFRRDHAMPHIEAMAKAIVRDAELYGVVLTIETVPTPGRPLAMGEHQMVVSVRRARELASHVKGWDD